MISFQRKTWFKGEAIQIYGDNAGLTLLIEALQQARQAGHLHLRSPAGGGTELSDVTPFGEPAIAEVIITTGRDC